MKRIKYNCLVVIVLLALTGIGSGTLYAQRVNGVNMWTGTADNNWDETTDNWYMSVPYDTKFKNGDIVVFSDQPNDQSINVETGLHSAGMYIGGAQNYSFSGNSILTKNTEGTTLTGPSASAKLVLGQIATDENNQSEAVFSGILDFIGISGQNSFRGGIDMYSGTLRVLSGDQLGIGGSSKLSFLSTPTTDPATLLLVGEAVISGDLEIAAANTGKIQAGAPTYPASTVTIEGQIINDGQSFFVTDDENPVIKLTGALSSSTDQAKLEKSGYGTLILSDFENYEGSYKINEGTLMLQNQNQGNFTLDNVLEGIGTLAIETNGKSDSLFIGSNNPNFLGTLEMKQGQFTFDEDAQNSLGEFSLSLQNEGSAIISGTREVASLELNGGVISVELDADNTTSDNIIATENVISTPGNKTAINITTWNPGRFVLISSPMGLDENNFEVYFDGVLLDANIATKEATLSVVDLGAAIECRYQLVLKARSAQSIIFAIPELLLVGETYELNATATSGLPVTLVSSDPDVAEIAADGRTLTIKKWADVGEVEIIATQPGNDLYLPAVVKTFGLTINKLTQTISFSISELLYVNNKYTLTATASSGLPVTFKSSDTDVAEITDGTLTIKKWATDSSVTITASQAGDTDTYLPAADVIQSLTINKLTQTISFDPLPELSVGDTHELIAAATSGLPVTFKSSDADVAEITDGTLTIKKWTENGTVTITASQAGDNDTYLPADDVTLPVNIKAIINKEDQTINFSPIPKLAINDDYVLEATATSGLPVAFTSSHPNIAEIGADGKTLTIKEWATPGTVTITASQPGDDTYNAASDVIQPINIKNINTGMTVTVDPATKEQPGYFLLDCGSGEAQVVVETDDENADVIYENESGNAFNVSCAEPGVYEVTFRVVAEDESYFDDYTIYIEKRYEFNDLVIMRWNNTLTVINNPDNNNGGFRFVAFKWYKNGELVGTDQSYSVGSSADDKLDPNDEYYVEVTLENETVLRTCSVKVQLRSMQVSAYPNPGSASKPVSVDADIDDEMLDNAVIQVFSTAGTFIKQVNVTGRITEVSLPESSNAVYIFVFKAKNGFTKELKVEMKN